MHTCSGLGKKLGKAMGLVAKEVKAMTQAQILEFQKAGEGTFAGHKLGFQDIKVKIDGLHKLFIKISCGYVPFSLGFESTTICSY